MKLFQLSQKYHRIISKEFLRMGVKISFFSDVN